MKRFVALVLALCLALSLAACKEGDASSSGSLSDSLSEPASGPESDAAQDASSEPVQPAEPAPDVNLITGLPLAAGQAPGARPVAIMVNNLQSALPQRGIGSADAIFEMVTEGGITRLLALYADRASVPQTGPVRSARDQHLQFAIPLNAVIVHIGTSIYAENLLTQYHYATINGMYLGATSFWFDEARNRAGYRQEHCWYTDASLIAAGMEKDGVSGEGASHTLFDFGPAGVRPAFAEKADTIAFSYSEIAPVSFVYDAGTGAYLKSAFGAPQIDESTGVQLAFDNVILLFTEIRLKNPDDANSLVTDFAMSGGTGYYFCSGGYEEIRWRKGNPEDPLVLTDAQGARLSVMPGKSYIGVVGTDRRDTLDITADGSAPADASADAPAA